MPKPKILKASSALRKDYEHVVQITPRITQELKDQAVEASKQLDVSLNRFVESAITYYITALEQEGAIK